MRQRADVSIILADIEKITGPICIGDIFRKLPTSWCWTTFSGPDGLRPSHPLESCVYEFTVIGIFLEEQVHSQLDTLTGETMTWNEVHRLFACRAIHFCFCSLDSHQTPPFLTPHLSLHSSDEEVKWNEPDFYTYDYWIEKNFDEYITSMARSRVQGDVLSPSVQEPKSSTDPMELLEL